MREAFNGAFALSALVILWWMCFRVEGWVGCTCLEAWKVVKKSPIKMIPEIFWLYFFMFNPYLIDYIWLHFLCHSTCCWSEWGGSLCFFLVITGLLSWGLFVSMWRLRGMWVGWVAAWCYLCRCLCSPWQRRDLLGLSLIVWRSEPSPKFTTHRGSYQTWPDPNSGGFSRADWGQGRLDQMGPDETRLSRAAHHSVGSDRPPHGQVLVWSPPLSG